jgi:hypothetical protein
MFLKKGPTTLGGLYDPLNSQMEKLIVRKTQAGAGLGTGRSQAFERLEKRVIHRRQNKRH